MRSSHATELVLISCLLASTLIVMPGSVASAQTGTTTPPAAPMVVAADYAVANAKVIAVDRADRTVVLQGEGGQQMTVAVAKQARNFDQIQPGDDVKVQLLSSIAVSLRKANAPPSYTEGQLVQLAPRGAQPGGVVVDTQQITATVDDIDYQSRQVTLTGPRANTISFKVGDGVQNLNDVKKGDQVVVRYTEAVAVSVDK